MTDGIGDRIRKAVGDIVKDPIKLGLISLLLWQFFKSRKPAEKPESLQEIEKEFITFVNNVDTKQFESLFVESQLKVMREKYGCRTAKTA